MLTLSKDLAFLNLVVICYLFLFAVLHHEIAFAELHLLLIVNGVSFHHWFELLHTYFVYLKALMIVTFSSLDPGLSSAC